MSSKNISEVDASTSPAVSVAKDATIEEVTGKNSNVYEVDEPKTFDKATQCCNDHNLPPYSFLECLDFCVICLKGKVVSAIIMIVTTVVRIASIVLGSVFVHNCPVQPSIPLYLIIGGVMGVIRNIIIVILQLTKIEKIQKLKLLSCFLSSYLSVWFIFGCVWIYQVYEPNYVDPKKANYCDKVLYLSSFWLTNSSFIFMGALFIGNIVIGCIRCCSNIKNETKQLKSLTDPKSEVDA